MNVENILQNELDYAKAALTRVVVDCIRKGMSSDLIRAVDEMTAELAPYLRECVERDERTRADYSASVSYSTAASQPPSEE